MFAVLRLAILSVVIILPCFASAAPNVVVSIRPLHSIVATIMDGAGEPALLLTGEASPHSASLSPKQAKALEQADMIIWIGPQLETFLTKPIATIPAASQIITGTDHVDIKGDPHIWLDPQLIAEIARIVATKLIGADAQNEARYRDNLSRLLRDLELLDEEIGISLERAKGREFFWFHEAYSHFERRYGLNAQGSLTVNPHISPGAGSISKIRQRIADQNIACVFSEPGVSPKVVAVVTEGTSVNTAELDPLGIRVAEGPQLYGIMMRRMARDVAGCLPS